MSPPPYRYLRTQNAVSSLADPSAAASLLPPVFLLPWNIPAHIFALLLFTLFVAPLIMVVGGQFVVEYELALLRFAGRLAYYLY